jgi:Uma2 family endonuclease
MAQESSLYSGISVEDYLRIEEASPTRHEYVAGYLHAMTGASKRHNEIVFNLTQLLGPTARRRTCKVWFSDVKLRASETVIYYPDLIVSCDPQDRSTHMSTRPCVIVEVLSPSTQKTDRSEKLLMYRGIESLMAYLVVHQSQQRVERHWRTADGAWRSSIVEDDGMVPCPCLDVNISLTDLYADLSSHEDEGEG